MNAMHESLLPIVNERRSKYARLVSLLVLSFATLVAFQFIIFDPYLDAATSLIETQEEQARFDALKRNIERRQAAYAALEPKVERTMKSGLDTMMLEISRDLTELNARVYRYVPDPLKPSDAEPVGRYDRGDDRSMQVQAVQAPLDASREAASSARLQEFSIPGAAQSRLRRANDWAEIRRILEPEIQEKVIDVRFSEYNERLRSSINSIAAEIEAANEWTPKDLNELPAELQALWGQVNAASKEAVRTIKAIEVRAPEDERWWWSREGKGGAGKLELDRSADLIAEVKSQIGYEEILASLKEQLATLQETIDLIVERQAEIEAKFEAFHETLLQLLGPLDWLPLNLNDLVFMMPLLVACSFGAGFAWVLLRRRAYVRLLEACVAKSEEVRELGFLLQLDFRASRVRLCLIVCTVVAAVWIVYGNARLRAFESLQASSEAFSVIKDAQSSALLNWGVSLVLLLGGLLIGLQSLSKRAAS